MKTPYFLFLSVILPFVLLAIGCATIPETVPVGKQDSWDIEADIDSHTAAYVAKGYTRERIIEILGEPKEVVRFKNDASVEVLLWVRTVRGALHARAVNSVYGTLQIQDHILYEDVIRIYLREDKLIACTIERERSTMERFGKHDHEAD